MKAGHGPGAGRHGPDRPGDESLGTELPFARHRAGADATGLPAPVAGGDRGLSWAIQMVVSVQEFDQKGGFCRSSGSNPLCITGVRVKLTGEPAGWMIFHHSLWNTAPPFHGTAAIQLWPVYQSDELWSAAGEVAGRVLYDRGGETFRASYHSLEEDTSPPTAIRASMDSGTFSGHFLCPLRRSTGGAMWSMPPMKFLTQNTEMCRIAGSITSIRTDFCNTQQKRHWKTGCPIMGHFGPSGAICATAPK